MVLSLIFPHHSPIPFLIQSINSELLNLSEEAKPISFSFENATSINILKTEIEETENLKIYNIFGQKVTPNYKSVLIYKGKKYLSR